MYIYIDVCVYIYIYTCMYIYIYVCISICMYITYTYATYRAIGDIAMSCLIYMHQYSIVPDSILLPSVIYVCCMRIFMV